MPIDLDSLSVDLPTGYVKSGTSVGPFFGRDDTHGIAGCYDMPDPVRIQVTIFGPRGLLGKSADTPRAQLFNRHDRLPSLAMRAKVEVTTSTFVALSIQ